MSIIYVIKENKRFTSIEVKNHNSIEENYWTISVYATEFDDSYEMEILDDKAVELSRYGPFTTYEKAKQALFNFAENSEDVVRYSSSRLGPTLIFHQHPVSVNQLSKNAHHYNISR